MGGFETLGVTSLHATDVRGSSGEVGALGALGGGGGLF
jgi:hypothetical protein